VVSLLTWPDILFFRVGFPASDHPETIITWTIERYQLKAKSSCFSSQAFLSSYVSDSYLLEQAYPRQQPTRHGRSFSGRDRVLEIDPVLWTWLRFFCKKSSPPESHHVVRIASPASSPVRIFCSHREADEVPKVNEDM
jgi:hypothetical protein